MHDAAEDGDVGRPCEQTTGKKLIRVREAVDLDEITRSAGKED